LLSGYSAVHQVKAENLTDLSVINTRNLCPNMIYFHAKMRLQRSPDP